MISKINIQLGTVWPMSNDLYSTSFNVVLHSLAVYSSLQNCCHAPGRERQWPVSTCDCKTKESLLFFSHTALLSHHLSHDYCSANCCTFQVGCQENREKPEITEPTNPIQCRPLHLHITNGFRVTMWPTLNIIFSSFSFCLWPNDEI